MGKRAWMIGFCASLVLTLIIEWTTYSQSSAASQKSETRRIS
jgi:heme/copper-type cytochrome/quinol oxidase subunit 4